jgi:hypothetical protein
MMMGYDQHHVEFSCEAVLVVDSVVNDDDNENSPSTSEWEIIRVNTSSQR